MTKTKFRVQIYTDDPSFRLSWLQRRKYEITLIATDKAGLNALSPLTKIMQPLPNLISVEKQSA